MTQPQAHQRTEARVELARMAAAEEAVADRAHRTDEVVAALLRKGASKLLEKARKPLKEARTPRMRVVQLYLCDQCSLIIPDKESGFVIHGNVYAADPNEMYGIIGNNIPSGETIEPEAIKKTVLCFTCMCQALGIEIDDFDTPPEKVTLGSGGGGIATDLCGPGLDEWGIGP